VEIITHFALVMAVVMAITFMLLGENWLLGAIVGLTLGVLLYVGVKISSE
jgi:hypothetical protein